MATTVRKGSDRPGAKKAIRGTAAGKAAAKKATKKAAGKAAAKKPAPKTSVAKKASARKAVAKKAVAKTPVAKKAVAKKSTAAKRAPAKKPRAPGAITPAQALENTRRLLEAKHAHDRETPPWQALEARHGTSAHAGFQDEQAHDQANALHAGESRMDAIQGAIGTQDRHNQGKRDKR